MKLQKQPFSKNRFFFICPWTKTHLTREEKLFNIQLVMSISRQQIVADLILSGCFQRYDLSFSDYVHNCSEVALHQNSVVTKEK